MPPPAPEAAVLAAGLLVVGWAALMVAAPQRLIAQVAGAPITHRRRAVGVACLGVAGLIAVLVIPAPDMGVRLALTAAGVIALALAYVDARLLIIPDIYSAALALLGLLGPLRSPLPTALLGALVGGGLVWGVRLLWRRMSGSDGLGFGDVKLAAALGCLLGPEIVLRAICLAAILGAALGLALRGRRRQGEHREPELIPFGAGLGLSGIGFLYWNWLR